MEELQLQELPESRRVIDDDLYCYFFLVVDDGYYHVHLLACYDANAVDDHNYLFRTLSTF